MEKQARPISLEKSLSPEVDILQPLKLRLMCAGSFVLYIAS